ncbi:MAG: response regulator [Candidatus Methylomirabilales bacterium]
MARLAAPHVLIVDDDPAVREALQTALSDTYVVQVAATGPEALALLRSRSVAAVILDAMLGDEDGVALIEPFRSLTTAPILILTGHSSETLAIRAVWAKADGYLRKPVDSHLLHLTLTRLLSAEPHADPMERVRRHLEKHPDQTSESLSGVASLSERHLRRRFQETYGKTPRRYATEARLARAAELLRGSTLGVDQIAQAVGYRSLAAFDKSFKHVYGITPSAFRVKAADDPRPSKSTTDPQHG